MACGTVGGMKGKCLLGDLSVCFGDVSAGAEGGSANEGGVCKKVCRRWEFWARRWVGGECKGDKEHVIQEGGGFI